MIGYSGHYIYHLLGGDIIHLYSGDAAFCLEFAWSLDRRRFGRYCANKHTHKQMLNKQVSK